MKKEDFLNSRKLMEKELISPILDSVEEKYPQIAQAAMFNTLADTEDIAHFGIGLKEFLHYLREEIEKLAYQRSARAKIKRFEGTRTQEREVLKQYFTREIYKNIQQENLA